jgi:catechol 2,3-dioxygenase-like lactoylglutathione lyase family enzyme
VPSDRTVETTAKHCSRRARAITSSNVVISTSVYDGTVLERAALVAFIPVLDISVARAFYVSTLGLAVVEDSPFALVVDANGTHVRITPVPDLRPQPFTICGWEVADIEETVTELGARGVTCTRYEGMDHSASGVWTSPSGDFVAWFVDPDGNTLSLTQFARP